ncbi:hypothetical protein LguiA_025047 [Lonicera macranthoides]
MSSRGGNSKANGVQSIPSASRKMVQSLKEIVNCPEPEIYATLKECNMDPNEAVSRLLSQDPFHEVKSKREKKKENKDSTEPRSHGPSSTSNRVTKSVTDRYIGRGGSLQFSSSESDSVHGKPPYKKENGTNPNTNSSYSASAVAGSNTNRRPSAFSDLFTTENIVPTMTANDVIPSAPRPSSGYQPAWVAPSGQMSMADIVKKGRPQIEKSTIPASSAGSHHEGRGSTAREHNVSVVDEWPLIEPSQAATNISSISETPANSEHHPDPFNLPSDRTNEHVKSETYEVQAAEDDCIENNVGNHIRTGSVPSRKMLEDNSGGASLFDNDLYKDMGSYQPHNHAFDHQEVEDASASVSSVAASLQELSILKEDHKAPPEVDGSSVVIPNHLQVETADCSHLSFGSFGSGINTALSESYASRPSRSNLEEAPTETDASSVGHSNTRNPEYYEDESLRTASGGNLVHRTVASPGTYDLPSASKAEELKQENAEVAHVNQYSFPLTSPGYTFENVQQLNSGISHSQMSSQMQNLAPFASVMQAYTNSLPSTLLAANVNPGRESDMPYSPFPVTQSMPTKYGNTVSSISGSTISMTEALKTAGFSSTQPTPQNLPGTSVASGPALAQQHLAVHPYSQSTLPLGPFANMIGYPFLPQSYTYMPSGFQQAFAGNSTYHQSLAAVLPPYKNSVPVSSLPQSAAVASGYGGFGNSATIPGNYPMNPPSGPAVSNIGYDDVMSSQYKDSSHLISLQQTENPAMWLHGPGSRAVPASTYYSYQGQQQAQQPGAFRQAQQQQQPSQNYGALGGYPNFYHSQTLEHQAQNPRDGPLGGGPQAQQPKQTQQIWQNGY